MMGKRNAVSGVLLQSIGCRTNQEELTALSGVLAEGGYRVVDNAAAADIIIVNTCSVTAATESKVRRLLSLLARKAPDARLLVTGCWAQQNPDEVLRCRGVHWVVGNSHKDSILDILRNGHEGITHAAFDRGTVPPLPVNKVIMPPDNPAARKTRFSVKIQEGCDFRCSYCIVPQLRGPSRSAQAAEVIDACSSAVAAGYKEIVLTGTHIGQFNGGGDGSLTVLIHRIAALEGDFRIRLSSLDPRDCSPEVLDLISSGRKVCDHLHVSLQSCSPTVLTAMNRPAETTLDVIERLTALRERFPEVACGADIIVGFPGETDREFEETCRQVERLQLTYAHVFRFSSRPGTPAAAMDRQLNETVKTLRSTRLRDIVRKSRKEFLHRLKGTRQRIIVEASDPVRGLTSSFIHVEIPDCVLEPNTWLDVSMTGATRGRYCSAQPVISKVA